ncbi:hypothetical protein FGO68_gene16813 [Halteria grandinella]|uniref:EF-hand domain-containing protein n=1 Tax=Halteria grandinella TaxID=5974 RepID=A0A8J8NIJ3_HALGN|nr:hypothetical protein FGO68_gene16813 [Halteria grandinella]
MQDRTKKAQEEKEKANLARKFNGNLSTQQYEDLKLAFDMMDKSGDKRLTARQIVNIIKRMTGADCCLTDEELLQILHEGDQVAGKSEGVGMDSAQFIEIARQKLLKVDVQDEIVEAFRVYDKDKTGFVSIDDMKKVLNKMGDGDLGRDEINEILREIDPEGTNSFKYEDFIRGNFDYFDSYNNNTEEM